MKKYLSVFKISFQQEFAYRLNFIMWRVRNVLQIFLVFFLWDTVFRDPSRVVFGYDRAKILTYVFGIIIIRAVVISARSIDIAGELSRGDLVNYLTKPVSYFKYWFTRDLSSKALNLIFAIVEIPILFLILKPPFFFQTNPLYLAIFFISLIVAIVLFFHILFLFNMFPMWYPDQAWGPTFLLMIFIEFLGGGVFPIDVLPSGIQKILYLTPFPYLIFAPLQIYLGKYDLLTTLRMVLVSLVWTIVLVFTVKKIWNLGLKVYKSEGK
jgi:ABC-2 type transport system permease protein